MSKKEIQQHQEFKTVQAELSKLTPAPYNPRIITDESFQDLCRSLDTNPEMLQARPVVALLDGTVIMGSMRTLAGQYLKWKTIPTIFVDLDIETAKIWMIRDNASFGKWQTDQLTEMLWELKEIGKDITTLGFTDEELKKMFDLAGGPDGNINAGEEAGEASNREEVPEYEFGELGATGLLWALNKHVLHPKGYEMIVHMDNRQNSLGFSIKGKGESPIDYPEKEDQDGKSKFAVFLNALGLGHKSSMDILVK